MARKKKNAQHENHDRWLVSYADFITLMFAFFVVMFASSQTDKAKAQQVSDSVKKALQEGQLTSAVASILGGTVDDKGQGNAMRKGPGGAERSVAKPSPGQPVLELLPSMEYLQRELKPEIDTGKVQLKLSPRGLVISLEEATFFPSGEDTIDPKTYPSIETITKVIAKLPNQVRLEGHTDSVPIHNARFRSNWQLSTARALSMLELLTQRYEIPEQRLAIAGYSDTAPVGSNGTPEGRARNRRADIVILNRAGELADPNAPKRPATPAGQPGAQPTASKPPPRGAD